MILSEISKEIDSMTDIQFEVFKASLGNLKYLDELNELLEVKTKLRIKRKAQSTLSNFILHSKPDYDMNWHHKVICDSIDEFIFTENDIDILILQVPPRGGKQCADSTPVFTSTGWKTHGDLKVGDQVFHPHGKTVNVIAVSEKTIADCRVSFFNGASIKCHRNHEWTLLNRDLKEITVETNKFFEINGDTGKLTLDVRDNYYTPIFRNPITKHIEFTYITKVELLPESEYEKGNCIQVDSDDGLYMVGDTPVPTHNSEIVSRRLPAYYLGKRPDENVVMSTYAAELAKKVNREVQRIIDTERYREIFPDTRLNASNVKSSSKGSYVRTSDIFEIVNHQGSFKSVGVGGPLTGFGYNLGIADDLIKDMKQAMSPTYLNAIWEWYTSVFFTRRAPKAKIVLTFTRWAEGDLIGKVLEDAKQSKTKVEVLSFPMTYEEDYIYDTTKDMRIEEGEPLWPNRFDKEYCEATKLAVGSKVWASLYQQRPAPSGGSIFQRDWFRYFREAPTFDHKILSLDATFSKTDTSDYVVLGCMGIEGMDKYLIDVTRDRMTFNETVRAIYSMLAKYPDITELIIEEKANGSAIIDTLKLDGSIKVPIYAYSPTASKEARASAISPQVEAGHLYLPDITYEKHRDLTWVEVVENEMINFPNGKNDDCVDMVVQGINRVSNSTYGWASAVKDKQMTPEEESTKARNEEIMRLFGFSSGGGLGF